MIYNHLIKLVLLLSIASTFAMQKPPTLSTWEAARKGDLEMLKRQITQHPNWLDAQEVKSGLTPLAWAVIQLDKSRPEQSYFNIVKWLVDNGANVNAKDLQGQTVLHKAIHGGNLQIINYLLVKGAQRDVNSATQEKGRTPLAEALRSSQDAIIRLSIENQNFNTAGELEKALSAALKELAQKKSKKLSTQTIIEIINLLRKNGASTNLLDEAGHSPAHYINEVQLVSEPERVALLRALAEPITPRTIGYSENDLPEAIKRLRDLDDMLKDADLSNKITMVIWTIQAAQKERNRDTKSNMIRIAMALLAQVKQMVKEKKEQIFKDVEPAIDAIRTILRDAALIASGKASAPTIAPARAIVPAAAPSAPVVARPVGIAPTAARPIPAAAPSPAFVPAAAPSAPAAAYAGFTAIQIRNLSNNSETSVKFVITENKKQSSREINSGQKIVDMYKVLDKQDRIAFFLPNGDPVGEIEITNQGIKIRQKKGESTIPFSPQYETIDIVINQYGSLSVMPA